MNILHKWLIFKIKAMDNKLKVSEILKNRLDQNLEETVAIRSFC
jgi:hypothetical protein